jgi:hypothetical protein
LAKFHQKKETLLGFNFSLSRWIHFAFLEQASKARNQFRLALIKSSPDDVWHFFAEYLFQKKQRSAASNLILQNFNS